MIFGNFKKRNPRTVGFFRRILDRNVVVNPPTWSNKKGKYVSKKEEKKDNTTSLNFLMDGLPILVKESVGEYTSTKYIWL